MINFNSKEWKMANPKISLLCRAIDNLPTDDESCNENWLDFNQDWLEDNDSFSNWIDDEDFLTAMLNEEIKSEYRKQKGKKPKMW
jgi:hypothetical protein